MEEPWGLCQQYCRQTRCVVRQTRSYDAEERMKMRCNVPELEGNGFCIATIARSCSMAFFMWPIYCQDLGCNCNHQTKESLPHHFLDIELRNLHIGKVSMYSFYKKERNPKPNTGLL